MDPRLQLQEIRRTWQPPRELERCRPREIRLTAAGEGLRVLSFALIAGGIAVGILLYVKASADLDRREVLVAEGLYAPARVTRSWKSTGKNSRYWVEYVYDVGEQSFTGRQETGRKGSGWWNTRSVFQVRYLPSDPRVHYVPGQEGERIPLWLPFPIAFVIMVFGWACWKYLALQRRLLAEGRPAPGVVLSHRKSKDGTVARYVFLQLSGSIASGKTEASKKPPAVGEVLCVLYEPDRARHNGVYPLSLVRSPHAAHSDSASNPPHRKRGASHLLATKA